MTKVRTNMAKIVPVNGGMLGNFFTHEPPMGGLFPNAKQAENWMKYYIRKGFEAAVKVVLL